MKNAIKTNIEAAKAAKKAKEAAEKAAKEAEKAKAEAEAKAAAEKAEDEAEKAKIEEFANRYADIDTATIKDIIYSAKNGELFFVVMGYDKLVADFATTEKEARKHFEWIYKSAREDKEERLLDSSAIVHGMMKMQRKFQIAHDAIEAGLIPEDAIIDENNTEHWIVGNKAYSTEGVEEANLDDIETKLSAKDRRTLLKQRIEQHQKKLDEYQKELDQLEAANEMCEDDDYEADDCEDDCEDDYEW